MRRISSRWVLVAVAAAAACVVLIGPWVWTDQRRSNGMAAAQRDRAEQTRMLQDAEDDRRRALRWIAAVCRATRAECMP